MRIRGWDNGLVDINESCKLACCGLMILSLCYIWDGQRLGGEFEIS